MFGILLLLLLLTTTVLIFLQQNKFGKRPSGERLERIQKSPNYREGQFQNINETPQLAENVSIKDVLVDFLFRKYPNVKPSQRIPSEKTDLSSLPIDSNVLIWFGHSSYFLQIDGHRLLVDPVFSGNASPLPGSMKSFSGSDVYSVSDLPQIDLLLITHDHYDHLDYETINALKSKVKKVVCGLGVGSHFEQWGYATDDLIEKDWFETVSLNQNLKVHIETARHFSGRSLYRNNTLWVSFVLKSNNLSLYLGGDSGYDTHFKKIGDQHGPFDLVILENGQYNKNWPYIHMLPEEVLQAGIDLRAKRIFPVHSSKFPLSNHPWDAPLSRISAAVKAEQNPLITPKIGEIVYLNQPNQVFEAWWVGRN